MAVVNGDGVIVYLTSGLQDEKFIATHITKVMQARHNARGETLA